MRSPQVSRTAVGHGSPSGFVADSSSRDVSARGRAATAFRVRCRRSTRSGIGSSASPSTASGSSSGCSKRPRPPTRLRLGRFFGAVRPLRVASPRPSPTSARCLRRLLRLSSRRRASSPGGRLVALALLGLVLGALLRLVLVRAACAARLRPWRLLALSASSPASPLLASSLARCLAAALSASVCSARLLAGRGLLALALLRRLLRALLRLLGLPLGACGLLLRPASARRSDLGVTRARRRQLTSPTVGRLERGCRGCERLGLGPRALGLLGFAPGELLRLRFAPRAASASVGALLRLGRRACFLGFAAALLGFARRLRLRRGPVLFGFASCGFLGFEAGLFGCLGFVGVRCSSASARASFFGFAACGFFGFGAGLLGLPRLRFVRLLLGFGAGLRFLGLAACGFLGFGAGLRLRLRVVRLPRLRRGLAPRLRRRSRSSASARARFFRASRGCGLLCLGAARSSASARRVPRLGAFSLLGLAAGGLLCLRLLRAPRPRGGSLAPPPPPPGPPRPRAARPPRPRSAAAPRPRRALPPRPPRGRARAATASASRRAASSASSRCRAASASSSRAAAAASLRAPARWTPLSLDQARGSESVAGSVGLPSDPIVGVLAQLDAADLAARGLRQLVDELDRARVLVRRRHGLDVLLQLGRQALRSARAPGGARRRP